MKSKKGAIQGQIFIYILTLIVTSLVLVYGYRAIRNILDTSEEVLEARLMQSLRSEIEKISTDYGSVRNRNFETPGNTREVCFLNNYQACTPPSKPELAGFLETGNNVFIISSAGAVSYMQVSKIDVAGCLLCVPVSGSRFSIRLEGLGDGARISQG